MSQKTFKQGQESKLLEPSHESAIKNYKESSQTNNQCLKNYAYK